MLAWNIWDDGFIDVGIKNTLKLVKRFGDEGFKDFWTEKGSLFKDLGWRFKIQFLWDEGSGKALLKDLGGTSHDLEPALSN